ncbi:hypothetical protein O6H91_08G049400 [Diphasiastrum complanatum]|uniref:Uncharacterized protein n=2 Tax=Diphasiastrum complanatum TaxID=34168 RepID=A0ACC2CX97_DIPCM|nr:hypothetical protein O6H91_08G046100 [Diphasiastrum complanatum]KAJ7546663.1 hypothetical protein O6H91_08G049400 [Diphasiastrum complanatum]
MGLLDKLWDDVVAGPQPEKGLGRLRKEKLSVNVDAAAAATDENRRRMLDRKNSLDFQYSQDDARRIAQSIAIAKPPVNRSISFGGRNDSLPSTPSSSVPASPSSASPNFREKDNVWRSVFHPGSNKAMDRVGSNKFDKALPNSPTVYDWLYSGDTKSEWR